MKHQKQHTLLVLENDPLMRKYISSRIRELQLFSILETCTPREAIKIIEERKPDVILYDILLEEKKTESLIAQVRNICQDYDPFIVALTAINEDKQLQKAYDLGANFFLNKGFSRFILSGILYNIISQIEYRNALKQQERFSRSLFELATYPMLLLGLNNMTVVKANHAAVKMYALNKESIQGKKIDTLSPEGEELSPALKNKVTFLSNVVQKKSDGKLFQASIACAYFEEAQNDMALITVNDITEELRKLEEQSALKHFEQLSNQKATTKEVLAFLAGEKNERRRISGELHDHIGQEMISLKLQMEILLNKANETKLQESLYNIRNNLIDVADLIHGLSEEIADDFIPDSDLTSAVKKLIAKISKSQQITVQSTLWEKPPMLSLFIQTNLYRIIEEALSNIVQHAPTSAVSLNLESAKDHLHLSITNHWEQPKNGINWQGMGLRLMQQRAALIGGKMLYSKTDNSFQVTLHLPIE